MPMRVTGDMVPSNSALLAAMVAGFNEEPDDPIDARLARAWSRSWPFNYNAVTIDIAQSMQLPIILDHMHELPAVPAHSPTKLKTPTVDDIRQLHFHCMNSEGVPVGMADLATIIRLAVQLGIVKLPLEK